MARKSTLKVVGQWLEAVLLHGLYAMLSLLPLEMASSMMGWVARVIGLRLKASHVARRNIRAAFPGIPAADVERIVVEMWDSLGRFVGEFPHVEQLARRTEVVGVEHLHALRDDRQAGLSVSAHLANWLVAGAVCGQEGLPATLIYRPPNNRLADPVFRRGHVPAAGGGLLASGAEGGRAVVEVLKQGGHVSMLVDQRRDRGIPILFFGRKAMTTPTSARLALKYGHPIVGLQVERLAGVRFRVTVHPIARPASGDLRVDTEAMMTQINAMIEAWVRARPGQWLWLHKRWTSPFLPEQ